MKKRIENFVITLMYEYAMLYDSPEKVFEHIFYVIGNGYELKDGIIFYKRRRGKDTPISLNAVRKDKIIQRLRHQIEQYKQGIIETPEYTINFQWHITSIEEEIAFINNATISLKDNWWTVDSFYNDIIEYREKKHIDSYIRPYPLSVDHSIIFKISALKDKDLLLIAKNLSLAWIKFLEKEIENGHCKPSHDWADEANTKKHLKMLKDLVNDV